MQHEYAVTVLRDTRFMASAAIFACALGLTLTGCAAEDAFPRVAAFDYQLGGAYEPADGVDLVVRDRTAPPADGVYSVCYVNAFQTQPGSLDAWPDAALLTVDGDHVIDPDWPDEALLDTSSDTSRAEVTKVLAPWIEGCAADGFAAVEFDNLDSFTRSQGALTLDHNLALAADLARIAHESGLAVGQKNAAEHAARAKEDAGFDFAVAEECAAYTECEAYTSVYGEAVIDIEYTDELPRSFAAMCEDPESPGAMILRDRDLLTPGEAGYVAEKCSG